MLHLLVLVSLICLARGDDDSCVSMKVMDKCLASELDTGVNVVSWAHGANKCNGLKECCERSQAPISEVAFRAQKHCEAACNRVCEHTGSNSHLYSATWPVMCKRSCQKLKNVLYFGLFGAQCPSNDESCLRDNFTLDLNIKDVPEVEQCRKDPRSCSECLINKTLPDYEEELSMCQSRCADMKPKKFGKQRLSQRASCAVHLYGQYINFIRKSCTDTETDVCTPDGETGILEGACVSPKCEKEKAKCLTASAPFVKQAAQMVASKWRTSCEESCETATEAAMIECIAKGEHRREEIETKLLTSICSFLDVRS